MLRTFRCATAVSSRQGAREIQDTEGCRNIRTASMIKSDENSDH